jgi:hypothetical protein
VINEIMINPTFNGIFEYPREWFELYNNGPTSVDLQNWRVHDRNVGGQSFAIVSPLIIPPNGYAVLGFSNNLGVNGGVVVDYVYGSIFNAFLLDNGVDAIILRDQYEREVDRVDWNSTFPIVEGYSMALKNPNLDNNVGSNWCSSGARIPQGDRGTPGLPNDCATLPLRALESSGLLPSGGLRPSGRRLLPSGGLQPSGRLQE